MKRFSGTFTAVALRLALLSVCIGISVASAQPSVQTPHEKPYAVEYYYKIQWGHADEFLQLYKKNHYPVMAKEKELGRILSISVVRSRFHSTEDGRWDYKVTIVWKNIGVTDDGYDEQALIKQLYPDQESYQKAEQRRFEIVAAHWDVPVVAVDLEK